LKTVGRALRFGARCGSGAWRSLHCGRDGTPRPYKTLMASFPLEGKVVLVTGAAKRIGRSIALRLASEGARVAVHYGASRQEAAETAADCEGKTFQADLAKVPEIERMFGEVERAYGRLDGLVNNAARYRPMKTLDATEEDWDWIHSVNLKSVFFSCQAGARLMLKTGGGRIVNLSSLGGIRPWSDYAPYCSSKAGVIMLTKVLAKALAPQIAVNSVAPGVIHFDDDMPPEVQRFVAATPMQRHGTGDEIAEAVTYFLTASSFVTGQILAVDGGLSLRA
jgi:NAD(P)-dependent dehydrogenase (short-subunit alcohol dehydrogenase family)